MPAARYWYYQLALLIKQAPAYFVGIGNTNILEYTEYTVAVTPKLLFVTSMAMPTRTTRRCHYSLRFDKRPTYTAIRQLGHVINRRTKAL